MTTKYVSTVTFEKGEISTVSVPNSEKSADEIKAIFEEHGITAEKLQEYIDTNEMYNEVLKDRTVLNNAIKAACDASGIKDIVVDGYKVHIGETTRTSYDNDKVTAYLMSKNQKLSDYQKKTLSRALSVKKC